VAGSRVAEYFDVALVRAPHLGFRPGGVRACDPVLPLDVVPAVDRRFEAGIARRAHDVGAAAADVRARQQGAIHQRLDAVARNDGGTLQLLDEAGAKRAPDGAAGVIGAEREEEAGLRLLATQNLHQAWHSLQGAAPCIDIDFEGKLHRDSVHPLAAGIHHGPGKGVADDAIGAGDEDFLHDRGSAGIPGIALI
jgi:hypothetical protein